MIPDDVGRFNAAAPRVERLELEGKGCVVDSEQVQHGRVEIVRGTPISHRVIAEVVGRSKAIDDRSGNEPGRPTEAPSSGGAAWVESSFTARISIKPGLNSAPAAHMVNPA
jgi:hypothetical protein